MTNAFNNLSKGTKRLVWAGYVFYLVWIIIFHGWDDLIDAYIKPITDNDLVDIGIMLLLYWLIALLIIWVLDAF